MNLLGKAMNKDFWREVRENKHYKFFRDKVAECWDKYCDGCELRALKYSEFKLFFTCGERKVYEQAAVFRRIAMHASALMALMYPEEQRYADFLMDVIFAICDEYTWCLPAHQQQNEYNDNSHIDLVNAETAFALAEVYTVLGDRLDSVIKSRIEAEIDRRIFTPYERENPYAHWELCTNNWVSVCTGSIACTYMLMRPNAVLSLIPRFESAMERFISGYGDDGICVEGCGYWNYGFGYYVIYSDMIKCFTDGRIDHFAEPKTRAIASFMQKMFLTDDISVSFSDSSSHARYSIGIQHYLKRTYPADVKVYDNKYGDIHIEHNRFCFPLRAAIWLEPEYCEHPDKVEADTEFFGRDTQWLIKKNASYGLAAKGGNNGEPHNHNDVGCFIFAKNGRQLITDPGSGIYTKAYFDRELRYTQPEVTSALHSLPIVGGNLQKNGTEYRAVGARFEKGAFSMDIAPAYGLPELKSLRRRFELLPDYVTLADEIDCAPGTAITERLVCSVQPEITDGKILVGDAEIYDFGEVECTVSEMEIRDGERTVYFLDFHITDSKFSCKIK